MKNIITISSLLIAGTLLANAGINVNFGSTTSADGWENITWADGGNAASSGSASNDSGISVSLTETPNDFNGAYSINNNGVGAAVLGGATIDDSILNSAVYLSNAGSLTITISGLKAGALYNISLGGLGGAIANPQSGNNATKITVSGATFADGSSPSTASNPYNGATNLSFHGTTLNDSPTNESIIFDNSMYGGYAVGWSDVSVSGDGDLVITISNFKDTLINDPNENHWRGVVSYLTVSEVSNVPEPSMFGLLAGLGALALVGARRRRRK